MKERSNPLLASPEVRGFNQPLVKDQEIFVAKNSCGKLLPTVKVRLITDVVEVDGIKAFMYLLDNPLGAMVACATSQFEFIGLTHEEVESRIKEASSASVRLRKEISERVNQLRTGRIKSSVS